MATTPDLTLLITSENSTSERRVTPSWTVAHFKARLEPITGIPAGCQRLSLKIASETPQPIEAANEDAVQLAAWPLQANAEIHVGLSEFILSHCVAWHNHGPRFARLSDRFGVRFKPGARAAAPYIVQSNATIGPCGRVPHEWHRHATTFWVFHKLGASASGYKSRKSNTALSLPSLPPPRTQSEHFDAVRVICTVAI